VQQTVAQSASPTAIAAAKPEAATTGLETASNNSDDAPSAPPDRTSNYITISDGRKFSVPTLVGLPIRTVIEMTAAQGLQVQISGSGTVREQAPAPGTQVPTGTKIIVRCGR
jgi:cell division protein FtsI (penicillin-binding protein 3)